MGKKERKDKEEKPLDRMTAKELREAALQVPEVTGVHGMNKAELLAVVKKARGIVDDVKKSDISVREIKVKIHALRVQKAEAHQGRDKIRIKTLRRRISRLKRKTRRAA